MRHGFDYFLSGVQIYTFLDAFGFAKAMPTRDTKPRLDYSKTQQSLKVMCKRSGLALVSSLSTSGMRKRATKIATFSVSR